MSTRGRFVTLEGVEGAGKSSAMEALSAQLTARGVDHLTTREPGGTQVGEAIREVLLQPSERAMAPLTELLLMFAARAEHLETVVQPALAQGRWVLCDRFTDASMAYQGAGRGLVEAVPALAAIVHPQLQPDLTLLLDLPVSVGLERARGRGAADRFEAEGVAFLERVRDGYLAIAAAEPQRVQVVDARPDAEQVRAALCAALDAFLGSAA